MTKTKTKTGKISNKVNSIHRLDHSLVRGSIITDMSIPWLLKILGDAIKQDVLLFTMLR